MKSKTILYKNYANKIALKLEKVYKIGVNPATKYLHPGKPRHARRFVHQGQSMTTS